MARPARIMSSLPVLSGLISHLSPQIRTQRWLIGGSFAALFAEVAFRLLEPWPLKFVFDQVLPVGSASDAPGGLSPGWLLAVAAAAIVAFTGLRALAAYLTTIGFALAGNRVLTAARDRVFSHLQRLSLSFHTKARTGDLLTRVMSDIGRLQEITVTALLPLVANILMLVGMLAVMAWMNWKLSLIALLILPLFFLTTQRLGGRIHQAAKRQRENEGRMGSTAAEAIAAMKTVQALSLEEMNRSTFARENASSLREGVQTKRLAARLERTVDVLIAIGTALVVWQGARLVMANELSAGDLVVFLAYLKNAFKPMRDMAKYTGRLGKAAACSERILEILETTPAINDRPDAVPAPDDIKSISFDGVSFGYGPERLAIENVSFTAREGDVIALVGPSGAGKTTIINLLMRLYDPVSGCITLNGRDYRDYLVDSLRSQIAIVPQETVLFAASVRDNIACGRNDLTDQQIVEAAKVARAHDFVMALPDGYDTVIGERGDTLSGGQRQRISLARAAVRRAPVLVLDEPTTGLDESNAAVIRDSLRDLRAGRITFIIAHDRWTIGVADRIISLAEGQVIRDERRAVLEEDAEHQARARKEAHAFTR